MSASRMRRWLEQVRRVEPRRVVHRDLGAEAAVAEVRPVADLAVADAHEVGEAVAGHVGEEDRLRAVGEDQPRARAPRPRGMLHATRAAPKPSSASDGCQVKTSSSVIRTSAWPSPLRSTKRRFGSSQSMLGWSRKERNGAQPSSLVALEEAGVGRSSSTRSSWPSPARSRNCDAGCRVATDGFCATSCCGPNRPSPRLGL